MREKRVLKYLQACFRTMRLNIHRLPQKRTFFFIFRKHPLPQLRFRLLARVRSSVREVR